MRFNQLVTAGLFRLLLVTLVAAVSVAAQTQPAAVTKLRESNGVLVATFPVGDGPFGIAFYGGSLWVANFGSSNVMKLSVTGMLTGTYKAGDGPLAAVCSDGVVYVVNNGGDSVTKLNATDGANLGSISVGRSPIGIAVLVRMFG